MKNLLLLISGILLLQTPLGVEAALQHDINSYINDTVWYAPEDDFVACYPGLETITSLPNEVPEPYRSLFPEAAAEYGADLAILTTVFYWENRGFPPADTRWATSPAGAQGPFQFMPGTWRSYGVDGDGDGDTDINDVTDAAYSAANLLASDEYGGKQGIPLGSEDKPLEKPSVANTLKNYNAGPNRSIPPPLAQETLSYINAGMRFYQDLKLGKVNGDVDGDSATDNISGCGGLGVSADGFVFPLQTSKAVLREGVDGAVWNMLVGDCRSSNHGCHGRWGGGYYYAADIHAPTGTPVVAARSGTVINARINGDGAFAVTVRGEDNRYYYYTHMGRSSGSVSSNESIQAGQNIGAVGTRAETGNGSAPHVHFDIASQQVGSRRRNCSVSACPGMRYLIDPYEVLIAAFEALPEN